MAIKVEVELSNLSELGVFEAAKAALQGVELSRLEWQITGSVIENMGLSIRYSPPREGADVRTILGQIEFWEATRQGEFLPETGRTPHHAVAKAVVAQAMIDERLPLNIEEAILWVEDRWIFLDAIRSNSDHHELIELGGNRFSVRARPGQENIDHFQNVVSLCEAVSSEYLREISRTVDSETGSVSAMDFEEI